MPRISKKELETRLASLRLLLECEHNVSLHKIALSLGMTEVNARRWLQRASEEHSFLRQSCKPNCYEYVPQRCPAGFFDWFVGDKGSESKSFDEYLKKTPLGYIKQSGEEWCKRGSLDAIETERWMNDLEERWMRGG